MKLLSILLLLSSVSGFTKVYSCQNNDGYELTLKTSPQESAYLHLYLSNPKLKLISNYKGELIKKTGVNSYFNKKSYFMKNLKTQKKIKLNLSSSTLGGNTCPGRTMCKKWPSTAKKIYSIEIVDTNKSYLFNCDSIL